MSVNTLNQPTSPNAASAPTQPNLLQPVESRATRLVNGLEQAASGVLNFVDTAAAIANARQDLTLVEHGIDAIGGQYDGLLDRRTDPTMQIDMQLESWMTDSFNRQVSIGPTADRLTHAVNAVSRYQTWLTQDVRSNHPASSDEQVTEIAAQQAADMVTLLSMDPAERDQYDTDVLAYKDLLAQEQAMLDTLVVLRMERAEQLRGVGSFVMEAARTVVRTVSTGAERAGATVLAGTHGIIDRYQNMDTEKKRSWFVGMGLATIVAAYSLRYGAAHPDAVFAGADVLGSQGGGNPGGVGSVELISNTTPEAVTVPITPETLGGAPVSPTIEVPPAVTVPLTPESFGGLPLAPEATSTPTTVPITPEQLGAPAAPDATIEVPPAVSTPVDILAGSAGPAPAEAAPAPASTTAASGPEAPNTAANTITPGEGWFQTMQDMGVPADQRHAILQTVGPQLEAVTGPGYEAGLAYKMPNGDWGIRMTPGGAMPKAATDIISAHVR